MFHVSLPSRRLVIAREKHTEPGSTMEGKPARFTSSFVLRPWYFLWAPVVVYAALIFVLSSLPDPGPLPFGLSDKQAHVALYAGFCVVILRAVCGARWDRVTFGRWLIAAVIAVAYGATDELHQLIVPGRTASGLDLVADALGAVAAGALAWACAIIRRPRIADSTP
jgi:VanZ family protein